MAIKSILWNWRYQLLKDERYHSRLSVLIVSLTCACPVVLAMAFSFISTSQDLLGSELSRRQAIVGMAAATLEEKLNRLTDLSASLATRVRFRQLVETGDWQEAIKILQAVPKDFPFVNRLLIVWTNKDLSAQKRERLHRSAQSIALKGPDGIDVVLVDLQRDVVSRELTP